MLLDLLLAINVFKHSGQTMKTGLQLAFRKQLSPLKNVYPLCLLFARGGTHYSLNHVAL